jgi:hypothetical protein
MISFQLTEQQEKVKAEAAEFARTVVFPGLRKSKYG